VTSRHHVIDDDAARDAAYVAADGGLSAPPAAVAVFGDVLGVAEAYARMLATDGVERGLIGPREASRLWDRHLLNCAVVTELVDPRARTLVDIGSGAGLPGLVLALLRPELEVVLLEPMERRCRFLSECVAELGVTNATVFRGRAEDVTLRADVATARAVAPLDRLAQLAVPLVRRGGTILAIKGRTVADELKAARPVLKRLGVRSSQVVRAGQGKVDPATIVVRFFAG
jgi:16S rRNA (guanine527-N7)-methyltransferase